jgi:glycosyltransferase involved in cell wall biosynthesis
MLSVVLATYNEEKNIARCLGAIKDIADEIIVVDGESTDNTIGIAKEIGARVISTTNKSNFHINKQMAMDEAKGELVFQLDADEVADKELLSFIVKIHQEVLGRTNQDNKTKPVAWFIKRKNLFLGHFFTKAGQYPDPVIRLYVNGLAKLPQRDVHEQMIVNGEIGWADGHLIHYANPTFADYLRKWQTYTSFKAQQLYEDGVIINFSNTIKYILWLPLKTFFLIYVRHKGFVDGVAGFVFSVMSGLYHAMSYLKLWELYKIKNKTHAHTL